MSQEWRHILRIKCYCFKENEKNLVVDLNSEKYKRLLSNYSNDLKKYYRMNDNNIPGIRNYYFDPDKSYINKNTVDDSFYKDLVIFLNKQEKIIFNKSENQYKYFETVDRGKGIRVVCGDEEFHILSDQFGFSAPKVKNKYPYDLYLSLSKDDDKFKDVARWISYSRTIGGSFLWPLKLCTTHKNTFKYEYNYRRGGTVNKCPSLQDRVDLALYEVYCYYNNPKIFPKTVLSKYVNKYSYSKKWFDHFDSFKKYVDYFCFKGTFVNDNYEVLDITSKNEDVINENSYMLYRKKPKIVKGLITDDELMVILENLSYNILSRSKNMLGGKND